MNPKLRFSNFTENWTLSSLGQVSAKPQYGLNSAAIPFDGNTKYIRITDIDEVSNKFSADPIVSPDSGPVAEYLLKPNDLVFARTGASTGKSYLYNSDDGDLYFAGFLIRFPINGANSKFVFNLTKRGSFTKWVSVMSMRSGQPGINASEYSSLKFMAPSLPEQKKIADFLGAVDDKIAGLRERERLLTQYKKGVMQKTFTQTIRFKDDDGSDFPDWETVKLSDLANIQTGKTPPTDDAFEWSGDIPFVTPTDLDQEKYVKTPPRFVQENGKAKIVAAGSIAYTCIASVGKMGLLTTASATNQQINSVTPKSNNIGEFLYYHLAFLTPKIVKLPASTTLPIINKTEFSALSMNAPHPDEQQKIADFLSAIDDKITTVSAQITQMQDFKKGLLQQMFV